MVPDQVRPSNPLPAGLFAGNGYGKLIGATQLSELGVIETPIVLTATLSAFLAADALLGWMLDRPECAQVRSLNPVVGECNDGFLSDIRSRPIRAEHVRTALDRAVGGPVPVGCVGAGTGTGALGFKAGIGTASRVLSMPASPVRTGEGGEPSEGGTVTIGVLIQANFGGTLRFRGNEIEPIRQPPDVDPEGQDGSCMIVLATDAPLDARQLTRVARRAVFGLGRVGASYGHSSGDYGIAFSTVDTLCSVPARERIADRDLDPIFEATLDIVEEAVLDSLLAAVPTTGLSGRTLPALQPDALR